MHPFILILTLIQPNAAPQAQRVGVMISLDACRTAGAGMELVIEAAAPGSQVLWACLPADGGA